MGAAMAATADNENESENESENGRLGIPPVLLFGLGFAGLVEMWDAASLCHFYQDNEAFSCGEFHLAFAVSAGVITVVLCLILAIMNQNLCGCLKRVAEMAHFVIGCTLALLWVAQVCVCTTQKPFAPASPTEMYNRHHPGNGYLASWASFIFSFRLLATTTYMQPRMAKLRHVIEEWRLHVKILATILFASVIESGRAHTLLCVVPSRGMCGACEAVSHVWAMGCLAPRMLVARGCFLAHHAWEPESL